MWVIRKEYTSWLRQLTGKNYRLPSESEWEYAARAKTSTAFSTGSCINTTQANFEGNHPFLDCPKSKKRTKNMPVGSYAPNSFGLYDMHGNVSEWVEDCAHQSYHTGTEIAPKDGSAWVSGKYCGLRVRRGGSWYEPASTVRSSYRTWSATTNSHHAYGFRVAMSL